MQVTTLYLLAAGGLLAACSDPVDPGMDQSRRAEAATTFVSFNCRVPYDSYISAEGISPTGKVVGHGDNGAITQGFLCDPRTGETSIIPTLGGDANTARAANASDQVIGWSQIPSGEGHSYLWDRGTLSDLGDLSVVAINAAGRIAGTKANHAVVWYHGRVTDLGVLPGAASSTAYDINDAGTVVGESDGRPFVWRSGRMTELVLPGGTSGIARGINAGGEVVGTMSRLGGTHAFLWRRGTVTDLGQWWANAINASGVIVGVSSDEAGRALAVFWRHGVLTPLEPAPYPAEAIDVTASGIVVGNEYGDNSLSPRMWTIR